METPIVGKASTTLEMQQEFNSTARRHSLSRVCSGVRKVESSSISKTPGPSRQPLASIKVPQLTLNELVAKIKNSYPTKPKTDSQLKTVTVLDKLPTGKENQQRRTSSNAKNGIKVVKRSPSNSPLMKKSKKMLASYKARLH